jgi:hypothetical protein
VGEMATKKREIVYKVANGISNIFTSGGSLGGLPFRRPNMGAGTFHGSSKVGAGSHHKEW